MCISNALLVCINLTKALALNILVSLFISTVPEVVPTHEDMEVVVKVTRELKGYITCLEGLR